MKDLRESAISGIIWSAFERFGQIGCAFVVQVVLARLLAPEAFGVIAMVSVFIAMSSVLVDAGFSQALVQRPNLTKADQSSVFYFNVFIGLVLTIFLYVGSPAVARFYGQVELVAILQALSITILIGSFGATHQAMLSRELRFKRLFWITFPSTLISGGIGIFMAMRGYGVWSLVGMAVAQKLSSTCLLWLLSGWRPALLFDFEGLKEMFAYGSRIALSNFLDRGFRDIYVLIIGKMYSAADVGFYQRAKSLQQLPVSSLHAVLVRVAFPLLSSIQKDPPRMKRAMRKANQIGALFSFPGMALLAAIAFPLIHVLLGEQWLESAVYLKPLCIVGALFPLQAMNLSVLQSVGRSDLYLKIQLIKKVFIIINVIIAAQFGVMAMIYGMVAFSGVALLINTHYTHRFIDYSCREQLIAVFPISVLSLLIYTLSCSFVTLYSNDLIFSLLLPFIGTACILVAGLRFMDPVLKAELRNITERLPGGACIAKIVL